MFSSFSNSYSLGYYKKLLAVLSNYTQMTYTITGTPNDAVLLNSPAIYPIDFVNGGIGKANGNIDGLNNISFIYKNISLYFKSNCTLDGFNYASTLFYFGSNPASANHKMLIMKNNSSGTSYKCVVGSNNISYIDTIFTTSGTDANFHTFIKISDNNELRIVLYDSLGVSVFDSGIVTIDSSVFGNDFTVWSLNHDATNANADTVRLTTTYESGKWDKVITDIEMSDHLTVWLDAPTVSRIGLVHYFSFTDGDLVGATMYDHITKSYVGDAIGLCSITNNRLQITNTTGTNSQLSIAYDTSSDYSVSFWVQVSAVEGGYGGIIQWDLDQSPSNEITLHYAGSTNKIYYTGTGAPTGTQVAFNLTTALKNIVITQSVTNGIRLYANGVLKLSFPNTMNTYRNYIGFGIGKITGYGTDGFYENIRIYNRILSQTDINDIMAYDIA